MFWVRESEKPVVPLNSDLMVQKIKNGIISSHNWTDGK